MQTQIYFTKRVFRQIIFGFRGNFVAETVGYCAVSVLVLFGQQAWAQDTVYGLRQVEIVARHAGSGREYRPGKLTLRADSLGRFLGGALRPEELLNQVEGLQVRNYGGHGGVKTVAFRGFGSNQTQVSIEQIPYESPGLGVVNLGSFYLQGLGAVTITPQAIPLWQNPGGGVLDLELAPQRTRGSYRGGWGSWGEHYQSAQGGYRGKRLSMQGGLQYLSAEDHYPYDWNGERGRRFNADFRHVQGQLALDLTLDKLRKHQLSYRMMGWGAHSRIPSPVVAGNANNATNERTDQQALFHFLRYKGRMNPYWTFGAFLRHQYDQTIYRSQRAYNPYIYHSALAGIDAQYLKRWQGGRLQLTVDNALQGQFSQMQGNNLLDRTDTLPRVQRQEAHLTTRVEFTYLAQPEHSSLPENRKNRQRVQLGVYHRLNAVSSFPVQSNAALHLTGVPVGGGWLELGLRGTRSLRFPAFNELFFGGFGNSSLRPEQTWAVEGSVTVGPWQPGRYQQFFVRGRLSGFANWTTQKIITIPQNPVRWSTFQLGRTEARGVEAYGEAGYGSYVTLWGSYTWLQAFDRGVTGGSTLPYTPPEVVNLGVRGNWRGLHASLTMQYVSYRYSNLQNDQLGYLRPYWLLDLNLNYTLRLRKVALEWGLTLQNLTDTRYALIQSFPMPGRSFRVEWGAHF